MGNGSGEDHSRIRTQETGEESGGLTVMDDFVRDLTLNADHKGRLGGETRRLRRAWGERDAEASEKKRAVKLWSKGPRNCYK